MPNLVQTAAKLWLGVVLSTSSLMGCGDGDHVDQGGATVDAGATSPIDAGTAPAPANDGAVPVVDSGSTESEPASNVPTPPLCDLSGVWVARQNTESLALGQPQIANTWYYFELKQTGELLQVVRHFDCGIEVRGTVRVMLAPATTRALIAHNLQAGRKGKVSAETGGTCSLSIEPFWSVRSVSEQAYLPTPRSSRSTLAEVQAALPLPLASTPERTEDWDADMKPGITWFVNGIVNGERNTVQRDWNRYFSAPGYTINAASDFGDLVVRAEFNAEEVVFNTQGLNQLSMPNAMAEHTLTLRFLGRSKDDPRATAMYGEDDYTTCANVRKALPSTQALR
jgi:hypothetical protein